MSFRINTNIPSLQAQEYLRATADLQAKTIGRVSSGLRITASGDDAAGLAIANGYRSDQAVLVQGVRNANDGLSTLQIVDGGINNISKLLDRARTLATQSASGTFTGSRLVLNSEFQSLLNEINRQAQSIGLDAGGQFAKNISVFIGGGRSNAGVSAIQNGSVSVDLSSSTVDAQSLGLSGVRAASAAGTDLSTSSPTTSVDKILNDSSNLASLASPGVSDFYFRGAGFSDDSAIQVSPNLSGVTDTPTLVEALNKAIEAAGNGTSAAATAFKNANVRAALVTDAQPDGSVKERIGFTSSNGAFQVQAGDRLANALLGNFSSDASGKSLETVSAGRGTVTGTSTGAGAANVIVRVESGGLAGPVDLALPITQGTTTAAQLATALKAAADTNAALQAAGITLDTPVSGQALVFRSSRGDRVDSQVAGDNDNLLGLGTWRLATDSATSFDYTSVASGAVALSTTSAQTFEFSIGGGPVQQVVVNGLLSANETGAAQALNAGFAANTTLAASGLQATAAGGGITITSSNGTAFRLNALAPGSGNFGFGTNATTGTGTAFAANYNDVIYNSLGGPFGVTAASNDKIYYSIDGGVTQNITLTPGVARTAAQVAADIDAITGIAATTVNGQIVITAENPNSKIELLDGAASALATLGYTPGQSNYAGKATVNSGGAYSTALGTDKDVFSFNPILDGGADQTITLSATDPQGGQQSLAVTLRNDAAGRNARSVDEAVKAINTSLQQSGNPTLKQIVAVKEQNAAGNQDGIRLLSTVPNFRVSVGASGGSTPSNEVGIYDDTTGPGVLGQGIINNATQSDGGAQLDISTVNGATTAVNSLSEAVVKLGAAQAVVGRGQNQFSFAVNLAQSQLTNIAAAESRIRDADLAEEAANLTKAQIILQAGTAALAQANSAPRAVLDLLRG